MPKFTEPNDEHQWQLLLKFIREKVSNNLTEATRVINIGLAENNRQKNRQAERKSPHAKHPYVKGS